MCMIIRGGRIWHDAPVIGSQMVTKTSEAHSMECVKPMEHSKLKNVLVWVERSDEELGWSASTLDHVYCKSMLRMQRQSLGHVCTGFQSRP